MSETYSSTGLEMTGFDRAQQAHDHAEPPDPRMCAPGEHVPNPGTFKISEDNLPNLVILTKCEFCNATGELQPQTNDFDYWEVWI